MVSNINFDIIQQQPKILVILCIVAWTKMCKKYAVFLYLAKLAIKNARKKEERRKKEKTPKKIKRRKGNKKMKTDKENTTTVLCRSPRNNLDFQTKIGDL